MKRGRRVWGLAVWPCRPPREGSEEWHAGRFFHVFMTMKYFPESTKVRAGDGSPSTRARPAWQPWSARVSATAWRPLPVLCAVFGAFPSFLPPLPRSSTPFSSPMQSLHTIHDKFAHRGPQWRGLLFAHGTDHGGAPASQRNGSANGGGGSGGGRDGCGGNTIAARRTPSPDGPPVGRDERTRYVDGAARPPASPWNRP